MLVKSGLLAILVLCLFLYFLNLRSPVSALAVVFSYSVFDGLIRWALLKPSGFTFGFVTKNLQLSRPLFLMLGLAINGALFLGQRVMLARTEGGMEQMAYLEMAMLAYSLFAIFLASLGNYFMGKHAFEIFGRKISGLRLILAAAVLSSCFYSAIIFNGRQIFFWIFEIEVTRSFCEAASMMILCYGFAFYSVRHAISKDKQRHTFYSTVFALFPALVTYWFVDLSAVSIMYSYSLFYLFLCVSNLHFILRGQYEAA
jgi:hypothetical protein